MDERVKTPQVLTEIEENEMREGMSLYEMEKGSTGWAAVKRMLEARAYHSWVDPMGMSEKDWLFAELNAYHAANNAKELLESIAKAISRADYLQKVKLGEIDRRKMKI